MYLGVQDEEGVGCGFLGACTHACLTWLWDWVLEDHRSPGPRRCVVGVSDAGVLLWRTTRPLIPDWFCLSCSVLAPSVSV